LTLSSENDARSILSRAKNRSDDGDSDDAKAANIHADCSGRLRVPGRGARPLIRIHPPSPRRVIAARYRCEPRTVFGALTAAFVYAVRSLFSKAAAILIDKAVKTNRDDGRYLVGERIKPSERKREEESS
jgi:hypothetical protein